MPGSTADTHRFVLLEELGLLHARSDEDFDRLVRLAAASLEAPIALLTFLGPDRQWLPARVGWDRESTELVDAFCLEAIAHPPLLEVQDAQQDERFRDNRLVRGPDRIRAYAGCVVRFHGHPLGTVCVLDRQARQFTDVQRQMLTDLAATVETVLRARQEQALLRSERQRALDLVQALSQSEAVLSAAERVARLGCAEWTARNGALVASAEFFGLIGADPAVPLSLEHVRDALHAEDRARFWQALVEAQAGRSPEPAIVRVAHPDGRAQWLRWTCRPVMLTGDGPSDVLAILQDATEQTQAVMQLARSEQRMRVLWETTTDLVLTVDDAGVIASANHAIEPMFGYAPQEVVGRPLSLIQPERLRAAHTRGMDRYIASGRRKLDWRAVPTSGLHRDGHEFPIEIAFSDLTLEGKRFFAAFIRDQSARQAAEDTLRGLEERLRDVQKMEVIGALAGGIAHDFNNILAAVLGNAALALDDVGPQHAASTSLRQIRLAGERGREMVRQILSFARRQPQELKAVPIRALLDEVSALMRATLPLGITLEVSGPDALATVVADATQIEQVLLNLGTNAVHAMGTEGRLVLGCRLEEFDAAGADALGLPAAGCQAHFWVSDTGHGMDEATLRRVFEPFFTTKPVGEGTGLGLSAAHGIAIAHRGLIRADSAVGQGTTFHLYVPGRHSEVLSDDEPAALPDGGALRGDGEHVVYIDDDEVMLLMVERLLQRLGYRVSAFGDPAQALAAIQAAAGGVDAVITDLNMPVLSGLDVSRELQHLVPRPAVILSSGNLVDQVPVDTVVEGVDAQMEKQNTLEELPALLSRVLRRVRGSAAAGP